MLRLARGVVVGAWFIGVGCAAGCNGNGEDCGVGDAPPDGLAASGTDVTLTFGNLTSLTGNDCPMLPAPAGVVSVSIEGTQIGGSGLITLCIPRPDLLTKGGRTLGTISSTADVRIIDLQGASNGCTFKIDQTKLPTGTATGAGVCQNGDDPAGFEMTIDGSISLKRTCNLVIDDVVVSFGGRFAVARRAQ